MKANALTRFGGSVLRAASRRSPEIAFGVATVSVVAGVVVACKKTYKSDEILQAHMAEKEKLKSNHMEIRAFQEEGKNVDWTEMDEKKEIATLYLKTGVKLFRNYSPAIFLVGFGIVCYGVGFGILRSRYLAEAASAALIEKGFDKYRDRVKEKYGEEVDEELYYGYTTQDIEKTVIDEDGNEKTVTEAKKVAEADGVCAPFTVLFDERSMFFKGDVDYNESFIIGRESILNDQLRVKGFLGVNDVMAALDLPKLKKYRNAGWIYNKDTQDTIAIRIIKSYLNEHAGEPILLLALNCRSNIVDDIPEMWE